MAYHTIGPNEKSVDYEVDRITRRVIDGCQHLTPAVDARLDAAFSKIWADHPTPMPPCGDQNALDLYDEEDWPEPEESAYEFDEPESLIEIDRR